MTATIPDMRRWIAAMALLFSAAMPLAGGQTATPEELFGRALTLHDAGDYAGAIAIYRELLKTMPDNDQVKYELTFSTLAAGDMAEAVRLAAEGANRSGPHQARYLELLGNAYDAQHKTRDAIAAYKRGIELDPKYPGIHFNLGVTYAGQNRHKEARQELEQAIELDPHYASAHYAIASVYRDAGYRVPAILAYGRFLSLSREGERAAEAAKNLQTLLNLGVKAEGGGNVNITVDPASKKDLGDFSALEMMAAIASGSSHLPEKNAMSDFEREAETLALFLTMLSEAAGDLKRGFVAKTYVPFYVALAKAEKGTAFAHVALAPLKLAGTDNWLAGHKNEVSGLDEWLRSASR